MNRDKCSHIKIHIDLYCNYNYCQASTHVYTRARTRVTAHHGGGAAERNASCRKIHNLSVADPQQCSTKCLLYIRSEIGLPGFINNKVNTENESNIQRL